LATPCGPECWPAPFGTFMTIFIAISLACCIVITTFGNLLVNDFSNQILHLEFKTVKRLFFNELKAELLNFFLLGLD
jgi:hypothetical protein